ncbi:hypothetical protein K8R03_02965 [Candidatus Kaiserbacteria bacterium]|nr:hypothetical protein [Candidatus Kaiserbacteria bacterium]
MVKETDDATRAESAKDTAPSGPDENFSRSGPGFWDGKTMPSACNLGVAPPAEDNPYKR